MSRNNRGWLDLNRMPVTLRKKTTPELQQKYAVLVNKGVRKRRKYKECLQEAMSDPLYIALQDNKERVQYFGTANGEGIFPRETAERVFINILIGGFTSEEAGQIVTGYINGEWLQIGSIYSQTNRRIMYRRLPIQGDLPASPSILKDFLTVDEFNALDPELKKFYSYESAGPAGPAPAENKEAQSEEGVAANHDDAKEPESSLNENTDPIKPPTGAATTGVAPAGSDFDADFVNTREFNRKAPDGTPTGTQSDIQTERTGEQPRAGLTDSGSQIGTEVSENQDAFESTPLEVGTSEVNHEQMQAERKAAYEREQSLQPGEEPVNQELIDQYNKTEAAQPSAPGPIAHEEATDTSEANAEGRV